MATQAPSAQSFGPASRSIPASKHGNGRPLPLRCRGLDSSMFFGRDGEDRRERREREARAKALCDQCVVIHQCRKHAMDFGETFGIWGGRSTTERLKLLAGNPMQD